MFEYDIKKHHFVKSKDYSDVISLEKPLSVSLQITRECNLKCVYCSETGSIPNPKLNDLKTMINNLMAINRIIVTGGEPLLSSDLIQTLKLIKKSGVSNVAISTNGTLITEDLIEKIRDYVDYFDITIDGPRNIHNKIRGSYDDIINGIYILKRYNMPFNIVSVMYKENVDSIFFICQISDTLGADKLKILTPINKGRGTTIMDRRLSNEVIKEVFYKIKMYKNKYGWTERITIIDWSKVGEGHALLIHPNGDVVASPVPSNDDCIQYLGNLLKENIKDVWSKYPYKHNHVNKYVEDTLYVC